MKASLIAVRREAQARGFTLFRVKDRYQVWYFLVCNDTWTHHGLRAAANRALRFGQLHLVAQHLGMTWVTNHEKGRQRYGSARPVTPAQSLRAPGVP